MYRISEEYTGLGQEVIKEVPELQHLLTDDVRIAFRASDRKKMSKGKTIMGECFKTQDIYSEWCPYDFFIVIYEPNCEGLSEAQIKILLEHELLHVGVKKTPSGDTMYYIRPHDYDDFGSITKKYGMDWCQKGAE